MKNVHINKSNNIYDEISQQVIFSYARIKKYIVKTPCIYSDYLSYLTGCDVYLKCEHMQYTGSFKYRGALSKLTKMRVNAQKNGVIAVSGGNHGIGVAKASETMGVNAVIHLIHGAPEYKINKIKSYGAHAIEQPKSSVATLIKRVKEIALREKRVYIPPFDDQDVIAGQGTIGLEIVQELPVCDAIYVAVGGGGLISGIGGYVHKYSPKTKIIGCWAQRAASLYQCIQAGKIVDNIEHSTISDGTFMGSGRYPEDSVSFGYAKNIIDNCVIAREDEINDAIYNMLNEEKILLEGAAAMAVACAIQDAKHKPKRRIVILLCGRNINLTALMKIMQAHK